MRHVVITMPVHGDRGGVTPAVLRHYSDMLYLDWGKDVELHVVATYSSEQDRQMIVDAGAEPHRYPNSPLRMKYQAGLYEARSYGDDTSVIRIDSDDLCSVSLIRRLVDASARSDPSFCGVTDVYMTDGDSLYYWPGYKRTRQPLGSFQMLNAALLDAYAWCLWPDPIDDPNYIDGPMMQRLQSKPRIWESCQDWRTLGGWESFAVYWKGAEVANPISRFDDLMPADMALLEKNFPSVFRGTMA